MKSFLKSIKESIKVAVIALAITLGVTYAFAAWTGPTSTPPNSNADAPINIGAVDQIKSGGLGINSLAVFGNSAFSGYVKVGSTASACDSNTAGAFRYDSTNALMEFCDGSSWSTLGSIAGGGSYTGSLVTGSHTGTDCTNAGGIPADIGGGSYVCKFITSSCVASWTKYQNLSSTQTQSCNGSSDPDNSQCNGTSCTTSSHIFSNKAAETCTFENGDFDDGENPVCRLSSSITCTAPLQEIGCY